MDDLEFGLSEDLASVLDNGKMLEGENNEKIREFFKKLLQTDAQIRKLKQAIFNNNYNIDNMKTGRYKRSIYKIKGKPYGYIKHKFGKNRVKTHTRKNTNKEYIEPNKNGDKRSLTTDNISGLTGYVIESKEVVIRYDPDKKRNFPKCSHAHEAKSHEQDLKNPFYKHSQRIDEMLDAYKTRESTTDKLDLVYGSNNYDEHLETLNAKLDTDSDEKIIESVTKTINTKLKTNNKSNKHENNLKKHDKSNNHENSLDKNDKGHERADNPEKIQHRRFNDNKSPAHHPAYCLTTITTITDESATETDRSETSADFDYNMEKYMSTVPLYDLDMSVSTFINPRAGFKANSPRNLNTGQRKLLQIDEEDEDHEELGYEDLKEVLADDKEGHDDMDRQANKKKRDNEEQYGIPEDFNHNNNNPLNIHNQNWKGPMPLYPDELNAMIKQAALQYLNIHMPVNTKDMKGTGNTDDKDISDTQYVEDYADKKYKKIIRMAQAYSDYGVLYNKKDNVNEDDKKVKPAYMSKFNRLFNKKKQFERSRKGSTQASNGIFAVNIRPGSPTNSKEFMNAFRKHVKFCGNSHGAHTKTLNSETPTDLGYEKLLTPTNDFFETSLDVLLTTKYGNLFNTSFDEGTTRPDHGLILTFKKGLRTLKSIRNMTNEDNDIINKAKEQNIIEALNLKNLDVVVNEKDKIPSKSKPNHYFGSLDASRNNIMNADTNSFIKRKFLRALKSIDMTDEAINDTINKNKASEFPANKITKKNENNFSNANQFNDTVIRSGPHNLTRSNMTNLDDKSNNAPDGIISFISMMSDWFQTLASLSGEMENEETKKSKGNYVSVSNQTTPKTKNRILDENITKDFLYPSYDVEIVDNIGHRSRVLMAVDDDSTIQDVSKMEKAIPKTKEASFNSETDDAVPVALVLAANDTENVKANKKPKVEEIRDKANKTVAKRSLGDNLVFWNDLYDNNEYGVKLDYMDNVRDSSAKNTRNVLHKSKNWLQVKISNVTHKLKGKWKKRTTTPTTQNILKKFNDSFGSSKAVAIKERHARDSNRNTRRNTRKSFAALTANMKNICQEAAKAIQNTKTVNVRENSKENAAATSLMHQLVRLMSDLVDIQVQQKTCAKLPSDLQNFLEWLTAPADDNVELPAWTPIATDYDDSDRFVKSTESSFDATSEYSHVDDKTECLGTIRAVQDLIQEYEGMTNEDKSKMTGVKEYLENQLMYLNNKLGEFDDANSSNRL